MSTPYVVYDTEVGPNRTILGIKSGGEYFVTDLTKPATPDQIVAIDNRMQGKRVAGYNSRGYDSPLKSAIMTGASPTRLYEISKQIIESNKPAWQVARDEKLPKSTHDEIDLMHYCPRGRLKAYEGRLGLEVKDLPFDPHEPITDSMLPKVTEYLHHDLDATDALYHAVEPEFQIRTNIDAMFGIEGSLYLSAARCAEAAICAEYLKREPETEMDELRAQARRWYDFEYDFQLPQWVKDAVSGTQAAGIVPMLEGATIQVMGGRRQKPSRWCSRVLIDDSITAHLGVGGLHTDDPAMSFKGHGADFGSYYPHIILREGGSPLQMNPDSFRAVYRQILDRRLEAKQAGDKATANSLKLIINATFGLTSDMYSALFSPISFLSITVTGQLLLIALADKLKRGQQ